jgi:hypothetical protein
LLNQAVAGGSTGAASIQSTASFLTQLATLSFVQTLFAVGAVSVLQPADLAGGNGAAQSLSDMRTAVQFDRCVSAAFSP